MLSQKLAKGLGILAVLAAIVAACAPVPAPSAAPVVTHETQASLERDPDVPELPFADNPDPAQCGIPIRWGVDDPAYLSGYYEGELVQPEVFLYNSHLRLSIAGAAPTGAAVRVLLFQGNPTLDYYVVETLNLEPSQEGWVPAPFLQFQPPE